MTTHPLWRPLDGTANAQRQSQRVAARQSRPGPVSPHDPLWSQHYETLRAVIERALGDRVLDLAHVGSTSVPGLAAKPVIDIDLTVADVTNEPAWLPDLESAGFRLIFRDAMAGDPHRQLTFGDPNANLHVWNPGAIEPRRHLLFSQWLREHPDDAARYEAAKAAAVADTSGARYNDLKAAVVHEILDRAFAQDAAAEPPTSSTARAREPRPRDKMAR